MHQVASEVPVPTDAVERELLAMATRRFTGRVKLTLRVKPEAALCVELLPPETTESERVGGRSVLRSPDLFPRPESSERGLLITRFLHENAERFRLVVKPAVVVFDFKEGTLGNAQWITVG
jgi:hypothetical protein